MKRLFLSILLPALLLLVPGSAAAQVAGAIGQLPGSIAPTFGKGMPAAVGGGTKVSQVPLRVDDGSGITLIGAVLYHPSFSANSQYNFYSMPTEDAEEIQLQRWSKATGGLQPNGGGLFAQDMSTFEYIQYVNYGTAVYMYYYKYDAETWETLDGHSVQNQQLLAYDLTRDPQDGTPYGIFISAAGRELGVPDYQAQTRTTIGKLSANLLTLSADKDGQLFGIATDGNLYRVSKTDAQLTLVGATGVVPADVQQSAVIEPKSGRLFWVGITSDQKSALYEVDTTTGAATKIYGFTGLIQIVCLNIKPSDIPAEAPAAVSNLSVSLDGASLEGTLSFDMPAKTFGGSDLSGLLTYHVMVNGQEDFTGEAQAGAHVDEDIELPGGQNMVQVYVSNSEGDGPKGEGVSLWAGDDVPTAPQNVLLQATGEHSLLLTWQTPASGINNGYMNPDDLSYDIIRYPDSLTVAQGLKATSFADEVNPKNLTPYSYDIVAKGKYGTGLTARSNIVKLGDAFQTPFTAQFNDQYGFDIFETIDLNGDGSTWHYYPYAARYRFNAGNAANDVLVTPPVKLATDRLYNLSFRYRTMGDPEQLRVTFGKTADDATAYATELMPKTELRNRTSETFSTRLRVDEAANYSMAFHVTSTPDGFHLFLDDITIADGPMLTAPDSVTALTVVAGDKGALTAELTFTAPTTTVLGEPLSQMQKIEVWRDEQLIHTFSQPAPGAALTFTDNEAQQGFNAYRIVAYDAQGNAGLDANCRAYVGIDTPDAPTNVRIVEEDNGNITITWDAPEKGVNGGYLDPDDLSYDISRVKGGQQALVDSYLDLEPYTDEVDQTGAQSVIYYGVAARNSLGQSDYQQSNSLVAGAPFAFPFRESFPNGVMEHLFLSSNHSDQLNWPMESADDDGGCIAFIQNDYDYLYFETGKISLEGAQQPGLVYSLYEQPGNGKLYVQLSSNTGERTTVETVDFAKVSQEKWVQHTVMLGEWATKKYVRVRFLFENDRKSVYRIDNINLRDVMPLNAGVSQLVLPAKASAGVPLQAQVTVANTGSEAISGVTLSVSVAGEQQLTIPVGTLKLNDEKLVGFNLSFNSGMQGPTAVSVELQAEGDQMESDNLVEGQLEVIVEDYPTVSNLRGSIDEQNNVTLEWQAPMLEGFAPTTTDDVEGYEPFIIDGIGQWTVYDGDGAPSYTIPNSQIQFPNLGTEFAVMVCRPYTVFRRDPANPYTHSGEQCFAFFDAQARLATETEGYSDDWLISPALSELQQTISFWARSMTTTDYAEDFEILFSTTGNLPADFQGNVALDVKEASAVWTEYKAQLPKGAKYFAIHMKSHDQFALLVDDITYQPAIPGGEIVISGYNVYRDGQLIGSTETNGYQDVMPGDGAEYQVSVVYATAESPLSEKLGFGTLGISDIRTADSPRAPLFDLQGRRVERPAKGLYVRQGRKMIVR